MCPWCLSFPFGLVVDNSMNPKIYMYMYFIDSVSFFSSPLLVSFDFDITFSNDVATDVV